MDIFAIRHRNLLALLPREGDGTLTAFAQRAGGMSRSFLSQLKGGKRMGDEVARGLENALALEHGWMDREGEQLQNAPLDPDRVAETAMALRIVHEGRHSAPSLIERHPELFVDAYALRLTMPDEATPADMLELGNKIAFLKPPSGELGNERRKGVQADESAGATHGENGGAGRAARRR